jgi:hypothetical protein
MTSDEIAGEPNRGGRFCEFQVCAAWDGDGIATQLLLAPEGDLLFALRRPEQIQAANRR